MHSMATLPERWRSVEAALPPPLPWPDPLPAAGSGAAPPSGPPLSLLPSSLSTSELASSLSTSEVASSMSALGPLATGALAPALPPRRGRSAAARRASV